MGFLKERERERDSVFEWLTKMSSQRRFKCRWALKEDRVWTGRRGQGSTAERSPERWVPGVLLDPSPAFTLSNSLKMVIVGG